MRRSLIVKILLLTAALLVSGCTVSIVDTRVDPKALQAAIAQLDRNDAKLRDAILALSKPEKK
jgi:hypothetical protein